MSKMPALNYFHSTQLVDHSARARGNGFESNHVEDVEAPRNYFRVYFQLLHKLL